MFTVCINEGYFTCGEDTHTLRLTSELVDLRVGYANPSFALGAKHWVEAAVRGDKKRTPRFEGCIFYGSGTRIRTQTYRVRVCCATFTQFRYCFTSVNDFTTKFRVCQGVFQKKSGWISIFSERILPFSKKRRENRKKCHKKMKQKDETK